MFKMFAFLFDLLNHFAISKNPFASIIYKKIIFTLIENHMNLNIREFILNNCILIIKTFSTIPVDFILEPLIK